MIFSLSFSLPRTLNWLPCLPREDSLPCCGEGLPVCEKKKVVGMLSTADVASEIKDELNQFIGLEEAFAKHH
jgi:hypothetical protein